MTRLVMTLPSSAAPAAASVTDVALFGLAERKFDWINARQGLLARNIANADTPGFRPRDVKSFSSHLPDMSVTPTLTSSLHQVSLTMAQPGTMELLGERAPDGNAVNLEDQMSRVAQDETQQALAGNLWKTYMGMFMTALGHSS